ncbi:MAG: hypothetical protein CMC45_03800 [Flavobacteriaceae bacterium]|nr:hypothetical protein [Flavobacteriaceae bacterium]
MNPLIINFFTLLFLLVFPHKYYVSTTLIDFDNKTQSFEITLKVFYDDLEKDLKLDSKKVDYIKDYEYLNEIYKPYLNQNFQINFDKEAILINYLGFEKKQDQINFYMEINSDLLGQSIEIQNSILYNSFPNQKNIILIRKGKFRKSFIQDKYNSISSLLLSN